MENELGVLSSQRNIWVSNPLYQSSLLERKKEEKKRKERGRKERGEKGGNKKRAEINNSGAKAPERTYLFVQFLLFELLQVGTGSPSSLCGTS